MNDKMRLLANDFEVIQNVNNTIEVYHLWSWQTEDIDLTKGKIFNGKYPWTDNYPKYPELRKKLSIKLGTDQFIWCYTKDGEAMPRRKKWELSVPKDRVRLICSITWDWILKRNHGENIRCVIPNRLWYLSQLEYKEFQNKFHDAWKDKTPEELWDMLFVNEIGECTHALLLCPIKEDWIIRRPSL